MNRVALITGGSRGIGLGIAKCLARDGFELALCGLREPAAVAEIVGGLRELGGDVLYCRCDLADASARTAMLAEARRRFGRLHVLVNNAGVAPKVRADLLAAREESFERVLRTNLQGPYFLTQAAARWMIEQKQAEFDFQGCIINISSVSATFASVERGEYCISKAGLAMATQLWAARLGEFGIPVYEVRPGVIRSDMTAGPHVQEKYDQLIAEGLMVQQRWGLPEDVGKACAMLARGELTYSTGQVLMVDGGMSISRL